MPDASTGESAHQMNKKVNKSNCGRQAAAHYVRRVNMDMAVTALLEGIPWELTRFDRSLKQHVVETVRPGPGCSAVLQSLSDVLPGGLSSAPVDPREATPSTDGQKNGQFPGAARWTSVLWEAGSSGGNDGSWEKRLATGPFRPDERTLLNAYKSYFGCGGRSVPQLLDQLQLARKEGHHLFTVQAWCFSTSEQRPRALERGRR